MYAYLRRNHTTLVVLFRQPKRTVRASCVIMVATRSSGCVFYPPIIKFYYKHQIPIKMRKHFRMSAVFALVFMTDCWHGAKMLPYLITTRSLCAKPLKLATSCAGHEILQIFEICTIDVSQYTTSVSKHILMRISIS